MCREWLVQLERQHTEIEKAGLRLAAIGLGQPKHAARYCPQYAPSLTCLCHPTADVHERYGLKKGTLAHLWDKRLAVNVNRARKAGLVQGFDTGPADQLSGTFIVDRSSLIRYAYISDIAGDNPNVSEMLLTYQTTITQEMSTGLTQKIMGGPKPDR